MWVFVSKHLTATKLKKQQQQLSIVRKVNIIEMV